MSEQGQEQGQAGAPAGLDELERLGAQAAHEEAAEAAEAEYIPGGEPEPEPAGPSTADVVAPLLGMGFSLIAARRGDHWNLRREEGEALAEEVGRVLDHYWPDQELPPWAGLAVAGAAIIGPRIAADRAKAAAEEASDAEARKAAEAAAGGGDAG